MNDKGTTELRKKLREIVILSIFLICLIVPVSATIFSEFDGGDYVNIDHDNIILYFQYNLTKGELIQYLDFDYNPGDSTRFFMNPNGDQSAHFHLYTSNGTVYLMGGTLTLQDYDTSFFYKSYIFEMDDWEESLLKILKDSPGESPGGLYTCRIVFPGGESLAIRNEILANEPHPDTTIDDHHGNVKGTYNWEQLGDEPVEYSINISASGTFCYGHQLSFNLSSSPDAIDGLYTLQFYNANSTKYPTYDYIKQYTGEGPLLYSKYLEPGRWLTHGTISGYVGEDLIELDDWLNFTVEQDCSLAFNGAISVTENPFNVTAYDLDWDPYYDMIAAMNLTNDIYFYSGWAFLDYLNDSGMIDPADYNNFYNITQIYSDLYNESNSQTNLSTDYYQGILTPLYMINDSVSAVRANINGSVTTLTDGIAPITSIFAWIFQMMPSWVINLGSIILSFDAVRIVLAGRKN